MRKLKVLLSVLFFFLGGMMGFGQDGVVRLFYKNSGKKNGKLTEYNNHKNLTNQHLITNRLKL